MNIQQFQYVLAVADAKNFEEAAERCYVTQSTLSTMIGRFEQEIGIKVFNRKTKPASITSEGEKIIRHLRIINYEIEQLNGEIQEIKGEMVGEIRIGIIPTIAPYLLPMFTAKFADTFPNVKIIVKEVSTIRIIEGLKQRTLDIGLLALPIKDPELVEQELYVEPFLVYDYSQNEPPEEIDIAHLNYSRMWLLQEGHCLRTQVHQICEMSHECQKVDLNFEFESGSMESLLRFTKSNRGMTIIPYMASIDMSPEDKKHSIPFSSPTPSRSVGILTHKFFVKRRLASKLSEIIQQAAQPLLPFSQETQTLNPI